MLKFLYNEESDKTDFPQTIEQHNALICIAARMSLSLVLPGMYHATSHGAIYMFDLSDMSDHAIKGKERIDCSLMAFFAELPGFRWIEIDVNACVITIALKHNIDSASEKLKASKAACDAIESELGLSL